MPSRVRCRRARMTSCAAHSGTLGPSCAVEPGGCTAGVFSEAKVSSRRSSRIGHRQNRTWLSNASCRTLAAPWHWVPVAQHCVLGSLIFDVRVSSCCFSCGLLMVSQAQCRHAAPCKVGVAAKLGRSFGGVAGLAASGGFRPRSRGGLAQSTGLGRHPSRC